MIIRSNLASSPIRNYSLFLLGSMVLGIVVVLFTGWNLISLSTSYGQTAELKKAIRNQENQLREMELKEKDIQARIARIKTPEFVAETTFMNNAIKRRTFSWTALFDHFEEVLPPSVKMISIFPTVTDSSIAINLEMSGQSLTDMLELVRLLERDTAFSQVVLKGENSADGNQIFFSVSLNYNPLEPAHRDASTAFPSDAVRSRVASGDLKGVNP
jgi:hypothetical protein